MHWWVSPFPVLSLQRCQEPIAAVCCARWVILALMGVAMLYGSSLQKSTATVLHRWVLLFSMDHPCCLLRSVGHPPSRCVAIPGVILAEMTGANSGCLLCPVDYPCIGRCRHVWWVILADARSQQRLFSIDGCRRSRWVIPAVCCARWVILASVGVAMYGGLSL